MSTLITGGTGFIGAEVLRQLLHQNASEDIHIIHRSGKFQRITDLMDRVKLIQADLADHEAIAAIIKQTRPDVIYHLGAMLSTSAEGNPQGAIETNAIGTYRLLEAARQNEVRQVLFASSIGAYGADIQEDIISDVTIQRPTIIYGVTKVFGEQVGAYYKRKYGLDFRGIRYPSIIGPGVTSIGVAQFTSWVFEEPAKGKPFTVPVRPETAVPVMHFRDAGRAIIDLGRAPLDAIQTVNYLVDGIQPTPTIGELADAVRGKIPDAQIDFAPDPQLQAMFDQILRPLDDSRARSEWGWQPQYDRAAIVEDFLAAI